MRLRALISALCCLTVLTACQQTQMADLPIKGTALHSMDWDVSPLRANYQYAFHGAYSSKAMKERVGDHYFLSWYDDTPEQPVTIVMQYTQAGTASEVRSCTVKYATPRDSSGRRKVSFLFVKEKGKNSPVVQSVEGGRPLDSGSAPHVTVQIPEATKNGTTVVRLNSHADAGDVLSWRVDIYRGDSKTPRKGDTLKSFLWN